MNAAGSMGAPEARSGANVLTPVPARLTLAAARRIALAAQGFGRPRPARAPSVIRSRRS